MNATLNALLLRMDEVLNAVPTSDADTTKYHDKVMHIVNAIYELLDDDDFEVTRDLFNGVGNDTRRAVIAGFAGMLKMYIATYRLSEVMGGLGKPTGPAGDALDPLAKILKQQDRRRN